MFLAPSLIRSIFLRLSVEGRTSTQFYDRRSLIPALFFPLYFHPSFPIVCNVYFPPQAAFLNYPSVFSFRFRRVPRPRIVSLAIQGDRGWTREYPAQAQRRRERWMPPSNFLPLTVEQKAIKERRKTKIT